MKQKISNILDFSSFYSEVKNAKIPLKVAYNLSKLTSAVDKELSFYREKLTAIIKEYAETDEKGNIMYTDDKSSIKLRPGTESYCEERVRELQNFEVDLPNISFKLDDFKDIELTMTAINGIMPFIKE